MGFLQLFQESVVSYIRAGFNLRAAWKAYEQCFAEISGVPADELYKRYDYHTVAAIQFGMGACNVAIASLPSKIVRIVAVFGLPHDRDKGFEYLAECVAGVTKAAAAGQRAGAAGDAGRVRSVCSPLAALILVAYYSLIPSFAPVLTDEYGKHGDLILDAEMQHHPHSAIHWWLRGRARRAARQLHAAGRAFAQAARGGFDFVQIVRARALSLFFRFRDKTPRVRCTSTFTSSPSTRCLRNSGRRPSTSLRCAVLARASVRSRGATAAAAREHVEPSAVLLHRRRLSQRARPDRCVAARRPTTRRA